MEIGHGSRVIHGTHFMNHRHVGFNRRITVWVEDRIIERNYIVKTFRFCTIILISCLCLMKKNGLCEKERDPWNLVTDLVGSTEPTL